jgi:hypothetical protein
MVSTAQLPEMEWRARAWRWGTKCAICTALDLESSPNYLLPEPPYNSPVRKGICPIVQRSKWHLACGHLVKSRDIKTAGSHGPLSRSKGSNRG